MSYNTNQFPHIPVKLTNTLAQPQSIEMATRDRLYKIPQLGRHKN